MTKALGLEVNDFYNNHFPDNHYHDDYEVDYVMYNDDDDFCFPDAEKVDLSKLGVIIHSRLYTTESFETVFKKWKKDSDNNQSDGGSSD